MIDLNERQREDLTEQFAELVVDNMSEKDLVRYAQEQLIDALNQYSIDELKEDVDNFDEELFDEVCEEFPNNTEEQNASIAQQRFEDLCQ